jgi:hypothetical protein
LVSTPYRDEVRRGAKGVVAAKAAKAAKTAKAAKGATGRDVLVTFAARVKWRL